MNITPFATGGRYGSTLDASAYGFSPSATAADNVTAWNAMMAAVVAAGGGVIAITTPGTYSVNACLKIPSKCTLIGLPGQVIIQQDTTLKDFVLRNTNGFSGDSDIYISGIIWDQGVSLGTTFGSRIVKTGTATSGTTTSLTDSGADFSLITSSYAVFITGGTGANQCRKVSSISGSNHQINITGIWDIAPDATSTYRVCIPKNKATKATTVNGASLATQAQQNSEFSVANQVAAGTNPFSGALLFLNCDRLTIRDCWIRDAVGNSLKISGGSDTLVENIVLDSVTHGTDLINQDGVHYEGGQYAVTSANATPDAAIATATQGSRNHVCRNIKANTQQDGRGVTDNLVAVVPYDYLGWNFLGGEIANITIEDVENMMAMESIVRTIAQKTDRSQISAAIRGLKVSGIRGQQSWRPKFGPPDATQGGYSRIDSVTSSTVFVIADGTTSAFPGGVVAAGQLMYFPRSNQIALISSAVIVGGGPKYTITLDRTVNGMVAGDYVAEFYKNVNALDFISDGGDAQGTIPDNGTAFTTVASGGGASVTGVTLTAATVNGRTLQVGDWIYNNTRGVSKQLLTVNTGTGAVTWSGAANFTNGDSVYLSKTYGLLGGSTIIGLKVDGVWFDTPICVMTLQGDGATVSGRSNMVNAEISNVYNAWPLRSGCMFTVGGTINDLRLSNITKDSVDDKRGLVDFQAGTVCKSFILDNIYFGSRTASSGGGVIGQNSSALAKIDQIKITNSTVKGSGLDWLIDQPLIDTAGTGTCRVFVNNCHLELYGLYNTRATGINVTINVSNCHLSLSDRHADASVSLSGSDVLNINYGYGLTLAGTVGQSRWTAPASLTNLAGATTTINWHKPAGVFSFSTDQDMHVDGNRVAGLLVYTGTGGHTLTFPQVARLKGSEFTVKNQGSGAALTLSKASADGSVLYDSSAVATLSLAAGATATFRSNGTYWLKIA